MEFKANLVSWPKYRKEIKSIREKVFVCEYHISPDIEFDDKDGSCHHVLIHNENGHPIATGRICEQGKISRLAVVMGYRNLNLSKKVLDILIQHAKNKGIKTVFIDCALDDVTHFKKHGFSTNGNVFMDAGIPKQPLSCDIEKFSCNEILLH